jgi:glycosyltransferase involved in cell wall biosynthesis
MRIAVDARELVGRPTGAGRYLAELLARWSDSPEANAHRWDLYAHQPLEVAARPSGDLVILPGNGGTHWEQWTLARGLAGRRPDVLFSPAYTAPLTAPCPTVVAIHDVSFAAHPEGFSPREGARRRFITRWSARRARIVLTISEFSRAEIVRHLKIPSDKVRVTPLGATTHAETATRSPSAPHVREPIVLFVGSIFQRRHVDRLIAAFAERVASRVPDSRLEIVGENRTHPPLNLDAQLQRYGPDIARRISLRSYVDDETLRGLYARASVFAFLSAYEGFGLTPLEALASGVPPVVLDTPVAREIYGAAARFVATDLSNLAPLGDALVELLTQPAARSTILSAASDVLGRYDWNRSASLTLAAIREAAGA